MSQLACEILVTSAEVVVSVVAVIASVVAAYERVRLSTEVNVRKAKLTAVTSIVSNTVEMIVVVTVEVRLAKKERQKDDISESVSKTSYISMALILCGSIIVNIAPDPTLLIAGHTCWNSEDAGRQPRE